MKITTKLIDFNIVYNQLSDKDLTVLSPKSRQVDSVYEAAFLFLTITKSTV